MQRSRRTAIFAFPILLGSAAAAEKHGTLALSFSEGENSEVEIVGVPAGGGRLGAAEVKRSQGRTRIKLTMDKGLPHPQSVSPQYTTYFLWAVAPEGRAERLAELPLGRPFRVEATTSHPAFGLVVTVEPHSAVNRPGSHLVAESAPSPAARGAVRSGTIEFEAAPARQAAALGRADFDTPLLVLGARRALEMAEAAGAADYAGAELREARVKLALMEPAWMAETRLSRETEATAREVMRLAEHARILTADRAERARTAERRAAQAAPAPPEPTRAGLEPTPAKETTRLAQSEVDRARQGEPLLRSLSAILETRREGRGLVVSLSDFLFEFNRASLTAEAQKTLGKLAGVLLAQPGHYTVQIEGQAGDRAQSVSDTLRQAGVPADRITRGAGSGESRRVELVIKELD